ncbi:MAG: hypothetical protein GX974_04530, partial [Clostridiales bacterium]|nr:hypothetical protein [Clostridiales bacterium]
MRRVVLLFLIMMLIISFLPIYGLAAPDEKIKMEARVGFDGYFQLGQWIPINVSIENAGEDIKGEIEVVGNQDETTSILYSAPAIIPKGSKKEINLYVLINTLQKRVNVDLISNGKLLKRLEIDDLIPMSRSSFLMGVLTDDQSGLNYWWEKQSGNRLFTNYEPILLGADDIPEKVEVMDNFSMLIVDDFDTGELTSAQKETLLNWVDGGGILIVGTGGAGAKALRGLDNIGGLEVGDEKTVLKPKVLSELADIEILADIPLEIRQLNHDGSWSQIVVDDSISYILMKRRGRGYVFASGFSLGTQPITGWTGSKALWEAVLQENLEGEAFMGLKDPQSLDKLQGGGIHYGIYEILANISEMDPPSAGRLILILIIYLLIVGPINYFIFKRLDRRELIWLTIPTLVLIFSFGIYNLGSMAKGSDVVTNTVSILDLSNDSSNKDVAVYTGVFIPKRGDYEFTMGNESFLTPSMPRDYYDNRSDDGRVKNIRAKLSQGSNAKTTVYNLDMWTMEAFSTRYSQTDLGGIDADLLYKSGKVIGDIKNSTDYPLEDVVVLTN